jgi:hypothetical protein
MKIDAGRTVGLHVTVQWRKGRDGCVEEYIVAGLMQQRMV